MNFCLWSKKSITFPNLVVFFVWCCILECLAEWILYKNAITYWIYGYYYFVLNIGKNENVTIEKHTHEAKMSRVLKVCVSDPHHINCDHFFTLFIYFPDQLHTILPSWVSHLLIQCMAGTLGGFTTTLITNPLDIIRARLQVMMFQ